MAVFLSTENSLYMIKPPVTFRLIFHLFAFVAAAPQIPRLILGGSRPPRPPRVRGLPRLAVDRGRETIKIT